MSKLQHQLIEFHRTFEHPIRGTPTLPGDKEIRLRASLVVEECLEFVEALFKGGLGSRCVEARDLLHDARAALKLLIAKADIEVSLVSVADALADIDYVVEGSRLAFGINGDPIADEVHRSNMAKKGGGKNAEGKTMKPKGWTPPQIHECLGAQVCGQQTSIKDILEKEGWQ